VNVFFTTPAGPFRAVARCVVEATGRVAASPVSRRWYYDRQLAFSTIVRDAAALHDLLWVESTPAGWWYLCAIPGGGAQLVWITQTRPSSSDGQPRHLFFSSGFARTRMIRSAFNATPKFESVSVCDARLSHSSFDEGGAVCRVGDASATSDPLSGRGWELALASGSSASEAIDRYLRAGDATAMTAFRAARPGTFQQHAAERASLWLAGGPFS
jgi:flavin-dependent dehydrogenase